MSTRKLQYIRLQGFRSFTEGQTFSFKDRQPGVYFLTGKNLVKSSLGGNATGKTTLWEGLLWCFFGKTSRNLRANNIVNWEKEFQCKVTVGIEINGIMHHIRRTQSPNSLMSREEGDKKWNITTEGQLQGMLQLSFESFLYSVMFAQFGDMFLDLKPNDKARVFSSVMDVDRWLKYSKLAFIRADECKDEYIDLKHKLSNFRGQLEVLEKESYQEEEKEWEKEKQNRLYKARDEVNCLKEDISDCERKRKSVKTEIKKIRRLSNKIEEELNELKSEIEKIEENKRKFENSQRDYKKEAHRQQQHIKDLEEDDGQCSRCGQELTDKHIEKEKNKALLEMHKAIDSWDRLNDNIERLIINLSKKDKKEKQLKYELKGTIRYISEAKTDLVRLLDKLDSLDASLASQDVVVREISDETCPWADKVETNEERAALLNVKINVISGHMKKLQRKEENTRYWVKGFKQVRLSLMDELLSGLEVETNNSLAEMGLEDWELKYKMEEIPKSGKEKKGFFTDVISPDVDHSVPWEVWSGGESQRLRIAAAMGLSNFIHYQLGLQWNIEVWDEPSNYLSESGIQSLLKLLQYRAQTENKQVWIVDHRTLDYGAFVQRFTVIKDEQGSFILEED